MMIPFVTAATVFQCKCDNILYNNLKIALAHHLLKLGFALDVLLFFYLIIFMCTTCLTNLEKGIQTN